MQARRRRCADSRTRRPVWSSSPLWSGWLPSRRASSISSPSKAASLWSASCVRRGHRPISTRRLAGRGFNLRLDGEPDRTPGGMIVHFRFDSLTDAGTARLEISVREGLVFAVRDAFLDVSELGIAPFSVPAVAEVELVAEKLRTLVQRSQPRDLFDLRLYLVESGWHLDPCRLATCGRRQARHHPPPTLAVRAVATEPRWHRAAMGGGHGVVGRSGEAAAVRRGARGRQPAAARASPRLTGVLQGREEFVRWRRAQHIIVVSRRRRRGRPGRGLNPESPTEPVRNAPSERRWL